METVLTLHVTGVDRRKKVGITIAITGMLCRMQEFVKVKTLFLVHSINSYFYFASYAS